MPLPFRLVPPEVPPGALRRPRLLRALAGRWDHRVTVVVGGAGLGKTTLLAQALAENGLRPRGIDVWAGVGPHDDGRRVLATIAEALGLPPDTQTPPPPVRPGPTAPVDHPDPAEPVPPGRSGSPEAADHPGPPAELVPPGRLVRSEPVDRAGAPEGVVQPGRPAATESVDRARLPNGPGRSGRSEGGDRAVLLEGVVPPGGSGGCEAVGGAGSLGGAVAPGGSGGCEAVDGAEVLDGPASPGWSGRAEAGPNGDVESFDVLGPAEPLDLPDPGPLVDAVWRRSPVEVCLVLDDVHRLAPGPAGGAWLAALVEQLPVNGHVVLATRRLPLPVPLGRLAAQREVRWVDEGDLRFDDAELARFAADRGVAVERLAGTGGWPALAELAAATPATGGDRAGAFLGEEVLEPLGERRDVLATVCDLGGGDDALLAAVLDRPVDLAADLAGVPLVERSPEGWYVPHELWRNVAGLGLPAPARARCQRRAVDHLRRRGALDTAFDLVVESRQWEAAPALLRDAGLAPGGHRPRRLGRWLAACPEDVRRSPAGRLAGALVASSTTPATAVEPLRAAARACRAAGDVDAELCAVAHLGRLGWYRQDPTTLGPTERFRVAELAAAGHPQAQALAAFGRAVVADLAGDDAAVLRELAGIRSGVLQPEWEVMTGWLFGMVHLGLGDVDAALDLVERHGDNPNPAVRVVVDGVRLRAWWTQGRVDDVLAATPPLLDVVRTTGAAPGRHMVLTNASVLYSHTGDLARARRLLDEGTAAARPQALPGQLVRTALAGAALRLAEGDEPAAAAALREVVERHGLDRGVDRRGWRLLLGATYVLLPETRAHWDAQPLRGYLLTARHLAATLVAGRQPGAAPGRLLRRVELPDVGRIRSALPVAHAAELAAGLAAAGRPEAAALLEALGPAGRRSARALAEGTGVPVPAAKPARALLAALPAPPERALQVVTLGVLAVHEASPVGGEAGEAGEAGAEVNEPELRRQRVRELLAFLVGHRRTTRDAITAALWPDLAPDLAGNNLSVTLNYLHRALEPGRRPGEASYLLRVDGTRVRLVTGRHLRPDTDDFDDHLAAARRAEADGIPSEALDRQLAAVALYRGDLFSDLGDLDWLTLDREHYRTRFVVAATRAAELLLGRGDTEGAEHQAIAALRVDPHAEAAHDVLISAALQRGDRTTARSRFRRCIDALTALGLPPSATTCHLQRRLTGPPLPPQSRIPQPT